MLSGSFFTDAFKDLSGLSLEEYHKTIFMNMEGPDAAALRVKYYKGLFRHMGENVKIGCAVKIVNPQYISVADNVAINDHCTLIARSQKGISLGEDSTLMYGVYMDTESQDVGFIDIGQGVYIGTGCCLHGHQGLEIGDHSLLAQNITITPYSHLFSLKDRLIKDQGGHSRKVTIGRDCYIGMNCCILYSADVSDGSVVGSGSVVVHSIPPYSVAVGVPAKVIKQRGSE
jgi:acetyltransferase-like isoleucine patch superfamily enzyme